MPDMASDRRGRCMVDARHSSQSLRRPSMASDRRGRCVVDARHSSQRLRMPDMASDRRGRCPDLLPPQGAPNASTPDVIDRNDLCAAGTSGSSLPRVTAAAAAARDQSRSKPEIPVWKPREFLALEAASRRRLCCYFWCPGVFEGT
ncbi:hypothetical protein scyTo_0005968 [Scyliorhinus torazame]|uniref:Uncharacterized protein n=1 Tax=Scyliorhinus torazame TaxID=75743 RepID=A0A401PEI9_SCYTO|nr:hypothetical protein [Scyliorhinus torazame]